MNTQLKWKSIFHWLTSWNFRHVQIKMGRSAKGHYKILAPEEVTQYVNLNKPNDEH